MKIQAAIFLFGPSGVGKNYCFNNLLKEYLAAHCFISGDWCRKNAKEIAAQGSLANDDLIIQAAMHEFCKAEDDHNVFVFDCPRSVAQTARLHEFFREKEVSRTLAVHMAASRDVCEARIVDRAKRQNRLDDAQSESIERRLSTYYKVGGTCNTVWPWLVDTVDEHCTIDANVDLELIRGHVIREIIPWIRSGPESVIA